MLASTRLLRFCEKLSQWDGSGPLALEPPLKELEQSRQQLVAIDQSLCLWETLFQVEHNWYQVLAGLRSQLDGSARLLKKLAQSLTAQQMMLVPHLAKQVLESSVRLQSCVGELIELEKNASSWSTYPLFHRLMVWGVMAWVHPQRGDLKELEKAFEKACQRCEGLSWHLDRLPFSPDQVQRGEQAIEGLRTGLGALKLYLGDPQKERQALCDGLMLVGSASSALGAFFRLHLCSLPQKKDHFIGERPRAHQLYQTHKRSGLKKRFASMASQLHYLSFEMRQEYQEWAKKLDQLGQTQNYDEWYLFMLRLESEIRYATKGWLSLPELWELREGVYQVLEVQEWGELEARLGRQKQSLEKMIQSLEKVPDSLSITQLKEYLGRYQLAYGWMEQALLLQDLTLLEQGWNLIEQSLGEVSELVRWLRTRYQPRRQKTDILCPSCGAKNPSQRSVCGRCQAVLPANTQAFSSLSSQELSARPQIEETLWSRFVYAPGALEEGTITLFQWNEILEEILGELEQTKQAVHQTQQKGGYLGLESYTNCYLGLLNDLAGQCQRLKQCESYPQLIAQHQQCLAIQEELLLLQQRLERPSELL